MCESQVLIYTIVRLVSQPSPPSGLSASRHRPLAQGALFPSIPSPCVHPTLWSPHALVVLMPHQRGSQFVSDEDVDDNEGTVIYSRSSSSASLRSRLMVAKICEPKTITTTPGLLGAGETETESEDQPVCARFASTSQCKSFVSYNSRGSSPPPASSRLPGH